MCTIHLGTRRVVVLCGYDAVKEALLDQAEEFSGRGEQATLNWIFQSYGERRTKRANGAGWTSRGYFACCPSGFTRPLRFAENLSSVFLPPQVFTEISSLPFSVFFCL